MIFKVSISINDAHVQLIVDNTIAMPFGAQYITDYFVKHPYSDIGIIMNPPNFKKLGKPLQEIPGRMIDALADARICPKD
jgi:hypothetical protein